MPPVLRRIRTANDEFQLVHALRDNRRQRQRQRRFLVEGVRPLNHAVSHGWTIEAFWYEEGRSLSSWARSHLERADAPVHVEAAPELFRALGDREEPSELLAVVEMREEDLERIPVRPDALVLSFDRPALPGNLGSVIRSADALGAHGVLVTGHAADVYDPHAIRASMGSVFAVPVVRVGSMESVAGWLQHLRSVAPRLQLLGSSAGAPTDLARIDLTRPTVLAIGNETKGLSHAWRELCDELVAIPMTGAADSLNVAAAASILLYEVSRQRTSAAPPA